MNLETEELAQGSVVGGYRVVRTLGAGGMSRVYEVVHERLGTHFALKVFARAEKGDVAFLRERFVAEGRLLARLKSPRLVRVHDLLELPTGEPCYVMDLVLGPDGKPATLEDMRQAGTVEERDVFLWYADMAEALRIVHQYFVNGVKDPLLFDVDDLSRTRAVYCRYGFATADGKHTPVLPPGRFSTDYRLHGKWNQVIKLRLVVGPDLLKERGLTPPKLDE